MNLLYSFTTWLELENPAHRPKLHSRLTCENTWFLSQVIWEKFIYSDSSIFNELIINAFPNISSQMFIRYYRINKSTSNHFISFICSRKPGQALLEIKSYEVWSCFFASIIKSTSRSFFLLHFLFKGYLFKCSYEVTMTTILPLN